MISKSEVADYINANIETVLTATEIKVADLIKHGHSNKGIAQLLNMAPQTVAAHRKNIRKKLAIKNTKQNLSAYLKTLQ